MFRIMMIVVASIFVLSVALDGGDSLQEHTTEYVTATQNNQIYLPTVETEPEIDNSNLRTRSTSNARGIKNNNPGNIVRTTSRRWTGRLPHSQSTDRKFEQFHSMEDGVAALIRLIYDYKFNWGDPTIADMAIRYCPEAPGSTHWANNVSGFSGIPVNEDYDWSFDNVQNLVRGIVTLECGHSGWDAVQYDFTDAFLKYRSADSTAIL